MENQKIVAASVSSSAPRTLRMSAEFIGKLACPCCNRASLAVDGDEVACSSSRCGARFPIVDGCPVLINEANSVFAIADFEAGRVTTLDLRDDKEKRLGPIARLKKLLRRLIPNISYSVTDFSSRDALSEITCRHATPHILVIGAGDAVISSDPEIHLLYTDVALRPLTHAICDAHDIPFESESFDAVVSCAVLEYVADPNRCVDEIFRVLRPKGFVYAVTPFMQQVHGGAYDFTRFTHLGHRRLFRHFDEIRSGVANGPAMALAWSFEHFVSTFSERKIAHMLLRDFARVTIFPVKYLDRFLRDKRGSYDAASAFYFFGQKSDKILSDRELVRYYKGLKA